MPRRKLYQSPENLKQKTLLDFLSSSPPLSPIRKASPPRLTRSSKRKRRELSLPRSSPSPTRSTPAAPFSDGHAEDPDSDVGAIHFEPEVVDISDGDESPRRPKRRKTRAVTNAADPHTLSDNSVEDIEVPRYRKGKNKVIYDSEDDTWPRKRKLIKGVRPSTPEEDDVLDAGNQILETRLRARGKMTAFQKNLEKFKNLKGKKRADIALDSSSSEAEQSESSVVAPIKGAKPHRNGESDASSDGSSGADEDVDDFIVEDDGAPATQLPVAFSLSTHQDLAHQFKIVCQLFVHLTVRPLADRRPFLQHILKEEQYFSVPLQVMRRKLSGLRDSLVASSVWRSDFKKDLERYPEFTLVRLDFSVSRCDACHLGGRVSTLQGRVGGKPYDEYDHEDVSDDESDEHSQEDDGDEDDDDDDDDDDDIDRNVKRLLHLGRFCAARTQVYHQFTHWEHSLYKSLQREITKAHDRRSGFVKVAYYGGLEPPRDLHNADKIMDWLDQLGIIDIEWKKVRDMMDSARNLEISWKRGDVDIMDMA